jgi:hypothetical protein
MDANPAQAHRMPRLMRRVFTNLCCSKPPRCVAVTLSVLAALLVGCGEQPTVRKYTISGAMPEVLRTKDRMLGAIIPRDPEVWFVKVVGPAEAIALAEPQVRAFASGLTFTKDGPDLSNLPPTWNRGGEKPMRFATLLIDTPDAQLDVSISSLPRGGDWAEQVAMNVNRWRGQMKLEESKEKWAGAEPLPRVETSDNEAFWIDLTGEMGGGPSMMPMSGSPMAGSPAGGASMSASAIPKDDSGTSGGSSATAGSTKPDPSTGLNYEAPEGWRPGKMSMMRLAAFNIGPEDSQAELTIITAGGDLRGNVARWLGQVRGDTPPGEVVSKALEAAETIKVSGREAKRYYLAGEASDEANSQAIDATIIPLGDGMSMFIKATGPPETVQSEKERIGEFISSLQLP